MPRMVEALEVPVAVAAWRTVPPPPLPPGVRPGGRFGDWRPSPPAYVVLDVDGTLLHVGPEAAADVAAAAAEALAAGLAVGYATGRLPYGVEAVQRQLRLPGPHVVLNGAQVRAAGRVVRTWPLAAAERDAVLAFCEAEGCYAELYVGDGFYVTSFDERARPHWEEIIGWPKGDVTALDVASLEVIKATVVAFDDAERDHVVESLRTAGLVPGPATSPLTPGMTYVNLTAPDADKGVALRAAAEHVGAEPAAVVAVGDGVNDLALFDVAGTSIAMGQSPREVLDAAHVVVPAVEHDGAAVALRAAVAWRAATR